MRPIVDVPEKACLLIIEWAESFFSDPENQKAFEEYMKGKENQSV